MYNVLKTVGQALSLGGVRGGKKAGIRLVLSKIERSTYSNILRAICGHYF